MSNEVSARVIDERMPQSAVLLANIKRTMAITAARNWLTFAAAQQIRALLSQLIGKPVDERFLLIPPFYTAGGDEIRIGKNVFIIQDCAFYDLGSLDITDDVLIGPSVSIITAGHPLEASRRRAATTGKPIAIGRHARVAAGAALIGGITGCGCDHPAPFRHLRPIDARCCAGGTHLSAAPSSVPTP